MNISLLGFLGFMVWALCQPSRNSKTTRNPSKKQPPSAHRKERVKGGLADFVPDSAFDKSDLEKGIKVEMEHTNDRTIAKEIAKDHLLEDPKYYDKK